MHECLGLPHAVTSLTAKRCGETGDIQESLIIVLEFCIAISPLLTWILGLQWGVDGISVKD